MPPSKDPIIRKCNLCGRLFPRSELTFVYPTLMCQDCCDMTDPSEGKAPWEA